MKVSKRNLKQVLINFRDSAVYAPVMTRRDIPSFEHVVFVCKGNICRSAFAEKYLSSLNSALVVSSFGIHVDVSGPPPPHAMEAARLFDIDLREHRSRCCDTEEMVAADLVLVMEAWQRTWLLNTFNCSWKKIRLLREFAPFPENLFCNIYDPYGHELSQFVATFSMIGRSIDRLNRGAR